MHYPKEMYIGLSYQGFFFYIFQAKKIITDGGPEGFGGSMPPFAAAP